MRSAHVHSGDFRESERLEEAAAVIIDVSCGACLDVYVVAVTVRYVPVLALADSHQSVAHC